MPGTAMEIPALEVTAGDTVEAGGRWRLVEETALVGRWRILGLRGGMMLWAAPERLIGVIRPLLPPGEVAPPLCHYCGAGGDLTVISWHDLGSGPGVTRYACLDCMTTRRLVPVAEHPPESDGAPCHCDGADR